MDKSVHWFIHSGFLRTNYIAQALFMSLVKQQLKTNFFPYGAFPPVKGKRDKKLNKEQQQIT